MKIQASYVVQLFARRSRKIRKDNTIMKANVFYVASLAMLQYGMAVCNAGIGGRD